MNKKDEEIQRKLDELETTILKETTTKSNVPAVPDKQGLILTTSPSETAATKSDLYYLGGLLLLGFGLLQLFQHVGLSSGGLMAMFGMGTGGFGLLLLPLMFGIGWLLYDAKSKIPWLLTAGSCLVIVITILSSLHMDFQRLSLLQTIIMLFPMALGGALLLKGAGGPKGVQEQLKKLKS